MPNKKAAIKHLRQTVKRTQRNFLVKKNIKDIIKKGEKDIDQGKINERAQELTHNLQKAVDKAVKSGILKSNTGNRKKSRFATRLKKAGVKIPAAKKLQKEEVKK